VGSSLLSAARPDRFQPPINCRRTHRENSLAHRRLELEMTFGKIRSVMRISPSCCVLSRAVRRWLCAQSVSASHPTTDVGMALTFLATPQADGHS
jgi:hypothetical protein